MHVRTSSTCTVCRADGNACGLMALSRQLLVPSVESFADGFVRGRWVRGAVVSF